MTDIEDHFLGEGRDTSEWGFRWHRADETMGQPEAPILADETTLASYEPPEADRLGPDGTDRFAEAMALMERYGTDRYYIAALGLSGFTIMTFLWGFARVLEDLYVERERMERLADLVFETEERIIRSVPGRGFDAVAFFDDWGTQSGMIISPDLWRDFFAPRYRKQFELCHALGLDVYFHSCGDYLPIVGDLIELGVDLLNVSQPNAYDLGELGDRYRGRVCFVCPVSYQTTSITGSCDEIRDAVAGLIDSLATPTGGLIGYVEEYRSIGLSDENYRCCIDAFRKLGRYPLNLPQRRG